LHVRGWDVVLCGRRPEPLQSLVADAVVLLDTVDPGMAALS